MEKLGKLKAVFVPGEGTLTAGNSSFLTDGAGALLIMTESRANQLGLKPKAYIRNYAFGGGDVRDPYHEVLFGPAFAIPKLLKIIKRNICGKN